MGGDEPAEEPEQTGDDQRDTTDELHPRIDRLEKSEIEVVTKTRFYEQYFYFILAALFFLLLELILRFTYLRSFP